MRLIDADYLKELIDYNQNYVNPKLNVFNVLRIIDNAPTTEIPRPQGEWVVDNWGMYHCNYCMKEKQQLFHNFCSYCGADMRGDING